MIKKNTKKPIPKKIKATKKTNFKLFALSNILVFVTIIAMATTYYFYNETQKLAEINHQKQQQLLRIKEIKEIEKNNELYEDQRAKYFEEKTKALEIEYTNQIENTTYLDKSKEKEFENFKYDGTKSTNEIIEEELNKHKSTINDNKTIIEKKKKTSIFDDETLTPIKIENNIEKKEPKKTKIEDKKEPISKKSTTQTTSLPKLAIIIDDVTTKHQVNSILKLGFPVNLSFLPPTPRHLNSAKIARELDQYMIHLPLQASSNKYDEKNTLYINDTLETIDNRIKIVKNQYPKARFLNNHTGSKFTSDQEAMDKLFKVLKKHNFTFVDSRTTAKSKAKISSKKYGVRLLSRNIFLDNKKDSAYIQNQLKKAIKIAKKHGSAIAIGHPYDITFSTLSKSKDLLEGVELVYVHQL